MVRKRPFAVQIQKLLLQSVSVRSTIFSEKQNIFLNYDDCLAILLGGNSPKSVCNNEIEYYLHEALLQYMSTIAVFS